MYISSSAGMGPSLTSGHQPTAQFHQSKKKPIFIRVSVSKSVDNIPRVSLEILTVNLYQIEIARRYGYYRKCFLEYSNTSLVDNCTDEGPFRT